MILEKLLELQDTINNNKRHRDYERICELAELYKILITGKNHAKLLRQFVRRENLQEFQQRVRLTQTITPAVCSSVMTPFFRVGRLDNLKRIIDYDEKVEDKENRLEIINDRVNKYWGNQSLDQFTQSRFIQLLFLDPNAFIVTFFEAFDPITEKATPYPFEIKSENAINFLYKNNILQWLISMFGNVYEDSKGKHLGNVYTMYMDNDVFEYVQCSEEDVQVEFLTIEGVQIARYFKTQFNTYFQLNHFQHNAGKVQAVRVGYKLDLETDARTYVNPMHDALPYFHKTIKAVSEMDLSSSLHAFPQKVTYARECPGESELITCDNGYKPGGTEKCSICNGYGTVPEHTSAQDTVRIPLPKDKDTFFDLSKLTVYNQFPTEALKWQKEFIDDLIIKINETIYNSDVMLKPKLADTATQANINEDHAYNVFHPFTENISSFWKYKVELIAIFTDNEKGINLLYEFPSDYKLKTIQQLFADLESADKANAPGFVRQAISDDIALKIYKDDPYGLKKYRTKKSFTPFLNISEETVFNMITFGLVSKEDQVLYFHTDSIFDELELEQAEFFNLTYEKQKLEVDKKVQAILDKLPKEATAIQLNSVPNRLNQDNLNTEVA